MNTENTTRPLTKGEFRVGISFNPSNNPMVDSIKRQAAELIDTIEAIGTVGQGEETDPQSRAALVNPERARLKALAQTAIEEAAMWAVKAATKS